MSRRRLAVAFAASLALLTGCGSAVPGTPLPEGSNQGSSDHNFAGILQECEAVTDPQIASAVAADVVERGFFGAICRWDGVGAAGPIKVTFNWFETGDVDHELAAFEHLGYVVETITVKGSAVYLVRMPADPQSCGVTAGAPAGGVFGWWIRQPLGGADACAGATKLAELTLNISI